MTTLQIILMLTCAQVCADLTTRGATHEKNRKSNKTASVASHLVSSTLSNDITDLGLPMNLENNDSAAVGAPSSIQNQSSTDLDKSNLENLLYRLLTVLDVPGLCISRNETYLNYTLTIRTNSTKVIEREDSELTKVNASLSLAPRIDTFISKVMTDPTEHSAYYGNKTDDSEATSATKITVDTAEVTGTKSNSPQYNSENGESRNGLHQFTTRPARFVTFIDKDFQESGRARYKPIWRARVFPASGGGKGYRLRPYPSRGAWVRSVRLRPDARKLLLKDLFKAREYDRDRGRAGDSGLDQIPYVFVASKSGMILHKNESLHAPQNKMADNQTSMPSAGYFANYVTPVLPTKKGQTTSMGTILSKEQKSFNKDRDNAQDSTEVLAPSSAAEKSSTTTRKSLGFSEDSSGAVTVTRQPKLTKDSNILSDEIYRSRYDDDQSYFLGGWNEHGIRHNSEFHGMKRNPHLKEEVEKDNATPVQISEQSWPKPTPSSQTIENKGSAKNGNYSELRPIINSNITQRGDGNISNDNNDDRKSNSSTNNTLNKNKPRKDQKVKTMRSSEGSVHIFPGLGFWGYGQPVSLKSNQNKESLGGGIFLSKTNDPSRSTERNNTEEGTRFSWLYLGQDLTRYLKEIKANNSKYLNKLSMDPSNRTQSDKYPGKELNDSDNLNSSVMEKHGRGLTANDHAFITPEVRIKNLVEVNDSRSYHGWRDYLSDLISFQRVNDFPQSFQNKDFNENFIAPLTNRSQGDDVLTDTLNVTGKSSHQGNMSSFNNDNSLSEITDLNEYLSFNLSEFGITWKVRGGKPMDFGFPPYFESTSFATNEQNSHNISLDEKKPVQQDFFTLQPSTAHRVSPMFARTQTAQDLTTKTYSTEGNDLDTTEQESEIDKQMQSLLMDYMYLSSAHQHENDTKFFTNSNLLSPQAKSKDVKTIKAENSDFYVEQSSSMKSRGFSDVLQTESMLNSKFHNSRVNTTPITKMRARETSKQKNLPNRTAGKTFSSSSSITTKALLERNSLATQSSSSSPIKSISSATTGTPFSEERITRTKYWQAEGQENSQSTRPQGGSQRESTGEVLQSNKNDSVHPHTSMRDQEILTPTMNPKMLTTSQIVRDHSFVTKNTSKPKHLTHNMNHQDKSSVVPHFTIYIRPPKGQFTQKDLTTTKLSSLVSTTKTPQATTARQKMPILVKLPLPRYTSRRPNRDTNVISVPYSSVISSGESDNDDILAQNTTFDGLFDEDTYSKQTSHSPSESSIFEESESQTTANLASGESPAKRGSLLENEPSSHRSDISSIMVEAGAHLSHETKGELRLNRSDDTYRNRTTQDSTGGMLNKVTVKAGDIFSEDTFGGMNNGSSHTDKIIYKYYRGQAPTNQSTSDSSEDNGQGKGTYWSDDGIPNIGIPRNKKTGRVYSGINEILFSIYSSFSGEPARTQSFVQEIVEDQNRRESFLGGLGPYIYGYSEPKPLLSKNPWLRYGNSQPFMVPKPYDQRAIHRNFRAGRNLSSLVKIYEIMRPKDLVEKLKLSSRKGVKWYLVTLPLTSQNRDAWEEVLSQFTTPLSSADKDSGMLDNSSDTDTTHSPQSEFDLRDQDMNSLFRNFERMRFASDNYDMGFDKGDFPVSEGRYGMYVLDFFDTDGSRDDKASDMRSYWKKRFYQGYHGNDGTDHSGDSTQEYGVSENPLKTNRRRQKVQLIAPQSSVYKDTIVPLLLLNRAGDSTDYHPDKRRVLPLIIDDLSPSEYERLQTTDLPFPAYRPQVTTFRGHAPRPPRDRYGRFLPRYIADPRFRRYPLRRHFMERGVTADGQPGRASPLSMYYNGRSRTALVPSQWRNFQNEALCPRLFGSFPDPRDCRYFIECGWGQAYRRRCPRRTFFNPQKAVCDWPDRVTCVAGYVRPIRSRAWDDS